MKLVWLVQDMNTGLGQREIFELSHRLAQRNHDVEIIFPRGQWILPVPSGVHLHPCGMEVEPPFSSYLLNLYPMIAAAPVCDWILAVTSPATAIAHLTGKLRQARVLSYVLTDERALFDGGLLQGSNYWRETYHFLTDFTHRLPLERVVNSSWTALRLRHGRGQECPIIAPGVDPAIFSPTGSRLAKDDALVILTHAHSLPWSGLNDLLSALNHLKKEHPEFGNFHLWIITRETLDFSAAQFPIRIVKPKNDLDYAALLRSVDLYVYPAWFDGFPLPPLEAMACGLPVVLTDCGGAAEYARHNLNCLLPPVRHPSALTRSILVLLQDPDLRRRLAEAGPPTAARFTWEKAVDRLEEILLSPRTTTQPLA